MVKQRKNQLATDQNGAILIMTLVFVSIFVIVAGGILTLVNQQRKLSYQRKSRAQALQIAEAGVNYYRWHLAHAIEDYADDSGETGCNPCGPYTHEYYDPSSGLLGYFDLEITPPDPEYPGSTIVKIKSTGWTTKYPDTKRHVAVRLGRPSLARYTTIVNDSISYGTGSETFGPVHSNTGVRFDGIAHNIVTAGEERYLYSGSWRDGVWTSQPDESEVFLAGKEFPVTKVDFPGFTQNLGTMALQTEILLEPSGYAGYHIQLQADNTFRYRIVESTTSNCNGEITGGISSYYGDWTTATIPNNGLVFIQDNVWVDGQIDGSRVTIVAAEEPYDTGNADIFLNNDVLYTNKDGGDVIGLIAQRNVIIGLYSEDNLEIDAILIAKNGRRYRPDYGSTWECGPTTVRNQFTLYGSTISYLSPYMSSGGSGYLNRDYIYDPNTLYAPPPFLPTTGEYDFILWEEVSDKEIY